MLCFFSDGAGEIVIPERVDVDGLPLPHSHHHLHKERHLFQQQKTDCDEDFDTVFYKLQFAGRTLHLELKPNREFVAAGVVFEHVWGNGSVSNIEHGDPGHHCFYRGFVKGDVNSLAALSICKNLVSIGILRDGLEVTRWLLLLFPTLQ